MAEGMRPNHYYHADPTYEGAKNNISEEVRKKEKEIRDFFEGLRSDSNRMRSLQELIKQYEIDLVGVQACRYDKEHVTGGKPGDLSDLVIRIEERMKNQRKHLLALYAEVAEKRDKAYRYLSLLGNRAEEQSILMDRYIVGESWERIARNHHYERDYCMQLRNRAIRNIAEKHF